MTVPAPEGADRAGPDPALVAEAATRLAAAKLWLVSTDARASCGGMPYLASAVYALVPVPTDRVATMTADTSWRCYANPAWVLATDVPVLGARLAHLVWHLLADHAARAVDVGVDGDSADAWRAAADATVADTLDGGALQTGLAGPAALRLPPGRSAEEYFATLGRLPATPRGGGPDRDAGDDADRNAEDDAGDDADPAARPPGEPAPGCGSACDGLPHPHELPAGDPVGGIDEFGAEAVRRRVAIAYREHVTAIGTAAGQWSRWVEQVLDPVVPWTQVLAAAVRRGVAWTNGHADYTYGRISRRQAAAGRVVLPATRRPLPEVAVVVDTSGSMDDGLLAHALAEVDGVLKGMGVSGRSVTVLATDAAVHAVSVVRSARDVRLGGGGGTDMGAGVDAALGLRPVPGLVAVLTDGWTPWPAVPAPVPVVAVVIGRHRHELPPTPDWVTRVECVP